MYVHTQVNAESQRAAEVAELRLEHYFFPKKLDTVSPYVIASPSFYRDCSFFSRIAEKNLIFKIR